MQQYIPEAMEVSDDHMEGPSVHYSQSGGPQFTAVAYGYPSDGNEYITIDHTLDSSTTFPVTDDKLLQGITLAEQNGHATTIQANGELNNSDEHTNDRHVSLNIPVKRKSHDGNLESAPMSGDSKRKRSKVSRACDQCRKKKIRCDADSEGSNNLRTCSNCQKSSQVCEYSRIPQKRGPSKGYIKELSERVQQVEGQLALQNSTTYRSSLDGQMGAFDTPFSPDDDATYKSRTSFSQQRSPFADFTRDRFPSVGGWNSSVLTSNPRNPSIAVPPDQVGPFREKASSVSSINHFWSDWVESPMKRRRDSATARDTTTLDKTFLQLYSQVVHPLCPILPDDEEITLGMIALAGDEYREAFLDVLAKVSPSTITEWNGLDPLEKFIFEKARERFTSRSEIDSLVLVWTELIFLVVMQHSVEGWSNQALPQCDLIRMSLDQCNDFFRTKSSTTDSQDEAAWLRVSYVATMLARLYAISRGESSDPVPGLVRRQLNINVRVLPSRAIFLVQMTDSLQSCLSLLPEAGAPQSNANLHEWGRLQSSNLRAWLNAAGISMDDPLVTEVKAFGELLSLRCSTSLGRSRPAIIGPAVNLAEAIRLSANAESEANGDNYRYNPLLMHTVVLATFTLLELLQCDFDDATSGGLVMDASREIRQTLVNLIERKPHIPSGTDCRFWAAVLLELVDERLRIHETTKHQGDKSEDEKISDLTLLLSRGYVTPVIAYASNSRQT